MDNKVVGILVSEGIPLNSMIVQTAFREYYNDNLIDYIFKLHSYDEIIIDERENKKG